MATRGSIEIYRDRFAMRGNPADHPKGGPTVFATHSTHKLLAALSQTSFIHIRDGKGSIDHGRFNEAYVSQASTSPLYPLIASNDIAAGMMDGPAGKALTQECLDEAVACRLALARLSREFTGKNDWFFAPWNAPQVTIRHSGKRVPFEHAPAEILATDPGCWVLEPGENWHGFASVPENWCMLDPIKLGIVCPGLRDDGTLETRGVPGDLVSAYLGRLGTVPSRTTDHMLLFLFSMGVTKGKWGSLIAQLLDFKRDYDRNAPLEDALPGLVAASPKRYAGLGLHDLGDQMWAHMRESRQGHWQAQAYAQLPRPAMTPRKAFQTLMAGHAEKVPLAEMAGRVVGVGVIPSSAGHPCGDAGRRRRATRWAVAHLSATAAGMGREVPRLRERGRGYGRTGWKVPRILPPALRGCSFAEGTRTGTRPGGGWRGRRGTIRVIEAIECARSHLARDRGNRWRRHLLHDRARERARRARCRPPLHIHRHRVFVHGIRLRRVRIDGAGREQRLYLFIRGVRRNRRVDHRLGADTGVRDRERDGRGFLVGLLHGLVGWRERACAGVDNDRLCVGESCVLPSDHCDGQRAAARCAQSAVQAGYRAWIGAPTIAGFHLVLDLPAVLITCLVTYVVYIGVRESRILNNIMVIVKLTVIGLVIVVGAFFVKASNWDPFLPNGAPGLFKGVSAVFFAYIGFDAVSTMAEGTRRPGTGYAPGDHGRHCHFHGICTFSSASC